MSTPSSERTVSRRTTSWSSVAFIIESMLLLVFLVCSLAVLAQLLFTSLSRSVESRSLDAATIAATSIAEHFAADPTGVEARTQLGDLLIACDVADTPRKGGIKYDAHITVYDMSDGNIIYELDTAQYVSEEVSWKPL